MSDQETVRKQSFACAAITTDRVESKSKSWNSKRLSVTELLQRVEDQTELSAKLFPLIDLDKYHRKKMVLSDSTDTIGSILSNLEDDCNMRLHREYYDLLEEVGLFAEPRNGQNNAKEDASQFLGNRTTDDKERCLRNIEKPARKKSVPVVIARKLSMPPIEWPAVYNYSRSGSIGYSILFGVHIEYMILSNKLRVNVQRFGNLPSECENKRFEQFTAQLFLLPGKTQKKRVRVSNGFEAESKNPYVYLSGVFGPNVKRREMGVAIYVKQGFFRQLRLMYEWTIPLESFDLIEPQTAWKKIDAKL